MAKVSFKKIAIIGKKTSNKKILVFYMKALIVSPKEVNIAARTSARTM